MSSDVHRYGFTVLHSGVKGSSDLPSANVVFVHGLCGNPKTTWETGTPKTSSSNRRPEIRSSAESNSGRRTSFVGQFMRTIGSRSPQSTDESTFSSISGSSLQLVEKENPFDTQDTAAKSKTPRVYWPRDLLPLEIPDARILTYGYDADVIVRGNHVKMNNFTKHGKDLLVKLQREIPDETPIIFCAHSLGGIIVKDALHHSKTNLNESLRAVHKQTKSIIFLGTPHRGSKFANWSQVCTKIAKLACSDVRKALVGSLQIDSEILERIQSDFVNMLYTGDFRIHSFQEGKPINQILGKIVDNFSSRFDDHPMQIVETIDASHRDMARFRSDQDAGYRQVAGALRHYVSILAPKHDADRRSIASNFSARELNMRTFFSVPFARNPDFVGREIHIQEIEKRFSGPGKTHFVAVHGLGGIGKSQVAVELAYRWKDSFPRTSIIWLHAGNRRRLDQSLREVMTNLGIPEAAGTDVPGVVERWLRSDSSGRWLLIVDNVDNEDVIFQKKKDEGDGISGLELISCLPKVEHGSILFTTRYRKIAQKLTNELVEINQMTEEEATHLLKKNLTNKSFNAKDIKVLLEELCYIPLAISHAAAFMRVNSQHVSEYLDIFRSSEEERVGLLGESFEQLSISSPDIPKQVLATWSISFDYVIGDGTAGPLASELLSVMSFMDRQEIPNSLLIKFRPKILRSEYAKAFGTLRATSLISENDQKTSSMHRLVQLSMRCWLKQQNKDRLFAGQAVALLADNFPDGSFMTWKTCSQLVVHAETVLTFSAELEDPDADLDARVRLLRNVAAFQSSRGEYVNAAAKFEEVLKLKTETVGAEDIGTLQVADALALVMRHQAKYMEAENLARKTLSMKEKLYGTKNAETLNTSHIVATILGDRGTHKEAEEQNHKILELRRLLLGADHPDTLKSANNLSLSLWELGRFQEAEELAGNVLGDRAKTLGEEHPDTLDTASTLGFILEVQGKYAEAEEIKRHVLDMRQLILGDDHPDTADSWHDMGWILHQQGNYLDAEDYYDRSLAAKMKLLGSDHPNTLKTLCNLPVLYCDKGDYVKAERSSRQIVHSFKRLQGPEHPQTLDALGDLAVVYRHLGKLDAALEAAQTSIAGRDKVIGKDHPWTLPTVSHMGYVLTLQNQDARGEEVIRSALAGLEAQLGKEHPQTLTSALQLSKNLARQDEPADGNGGDGNDADDAGSGGSGGAKLEEAEALARRVWDARRRVLGPDHPYTYKAVRQLAYVLMREGRLEDAARACRDALVGLQATLGTEHPDVSACGMLYSEIREGMDGEEGLGLGLGMGMGTMVVDLRRDSASSSDALSP